MRSTKEVIERARGPAPGHKERFIRDDVVRGLGVRIMQSGIKAFVFEGRVCYRWRRLTIGRWPGLSDAQAREVVRADTGRCRPALCSRLA